MVRGGQVSEKDIEEIANASDGEGFSTGQELLAFLVVSSPEGAALQKVLDKSVKVLSNASRKFRKVPKVPGKSWISAILGGAVFAGQIAWFFTDPINKFDLKRMQGQYDSVLNAMEQSKQQAIRERMQFLKNNPRFSNLGEEQLQEKAEKEFQFSKKQIQNIKNLLSRTMRELEVEISQSVEMTLNNISEQGGSLTSNNMEERIKIIRSFNAIGFKLKNSLKQMNDLEVFINGSNYDDAYKTIKETKNQATELFNQVKVPDTAISLEEQKTSVVTTTSEDPDRSLSPKELKNLLAAYLKDKEMLELDKPGMDEDELTFCLIEYIHGPLKVKDSKTASRGVGFSGKFKSGAKGFQAATKRTKNLRSSGLQGRIYNGDISGFNPITEATPDWDKSNPDISSRNILFQIYDVKGLYLSRKQQGNANKSLYAIPKAFGYDGMLNRFGYWGDVFLGGNTKEDYKNAMSRYFKQAKDFQTKNLNINALEATHEVSQKHSDSKKWFRSLYKYRDNIKGDYNPYDSFVADTPMGDRNNILALFENLEIRFDEGELKNLRKLVMREFRFTIDEMKGETDYPTSRGDLTSSDLSLVERFFKSLYFKIEFDIAILSFKALTFSLAPTTAL